MPDSPPGEIRNLPAVVPASETRAERQNIFARIARALFGWRSGTTRASPTHTIRSGRYTDT